MILGKPQPRSEVAKTIRDWIRREDVKLTFSKHAEDEMRNDRLTRIDIVRILRSCAVMESHMGRFDWLYTAESKTVDGDAVAVVVALFEAEIRIEVVTVFKRENR